MSGVSVSGRRNHRGGVIATITIMLVLALSSCSGKGNPTAPGENQPNERNSIFRAALWESTDQDVQNGLYTGGHIDVTNVVYGSYFESQGLQGYILKIGEVGSGGATFDAALTVGAWHEFDGSNFNVFFRIFYLWLNKSTNEIEAGMSDVYSISNPDNGRQVFPAVTAHIGELVPMDASLTFGLCIDIAYNRFEAYEFPLVQHRRYLINVTEMDPADDPPSNGGVFFGAMNESSPLTLPIPYGAEGSCYFPDISFYSFPDDTGTGNEEVETLFAVYEFESAMEEPQKDFYGIIYADFEENEWDSSRARFLRTVDADGNVYLRHPRIDAGMDFAYGGINVATAVWYEWRDDIIDDYDCRARSFDISDWPTVSDVASQIDLPNPAFIWSFYPYVDFDPIEKFFVGSLDTYAHFVYTKGQDGSNSHFKVTYTSSAMADIGSEQDIFVQANYDSGYPANAAFASQGIDDDTPDFDVVFLSNHEGSDFLVYSQQAELLNEACTSVSTFGISAEQISDSSNESAWQSPSYTPLIYAPVNAIFDWRSEQACWTHQDTYSHVFGDYEIRE